VERGKGKLELVVLGSDDRGNRRGSAIFHDDHRVIRIHCFRRWTSLCEDVAAARFRHCSFVVSGTIKIMRATDRLIA